VAVRYRCNATFGGGTDDEVTVHSPSFRVPGHAWWFAHGLAEHVGEHMHVLRDLEGKAIEGSVDATTEGRVATYTVAPVGGTQRPPISPNRLREKETPNVT
jgi:hypothetical protein